MQTSSPSPIILPNREKVLTLAREKLGVIRNPRFREFAKTALEEYADNGSMRKLEKVFNFRWYPVEMEEFLYSAKYCKAKEYMYPEIVKELIEINSGKYVEVLWVGGIGSGKTTGALYTQLYQLYLISCYKNPHAIYQLDPSSEILFVFQSVTESKAKAVGFDRFKSMVDGCAYFPKYYPYNHKLESKLVFGNRVEVRPIGGGQFAAIGENVFSGVIDEVNYMQVVQKSKKSVDGGTYDQAVSTYNSMARRRKTRFLQLGSLPGILCVVSSRRYPGQFTDQKEEEAKSDPTIYVYDKRVWDIKPPGTFVSGFFKVDKGDTTTRPRIVTDVEASVLPEGRVVEIPNEFKDSFERDIFDSLREIAGVSTLASHPYFTDRNAIANAFSRPKSLLTGFEANFLDRNISIIRSNITYEKPRWVHLDLALTGDSLGASMGYVDGFVEMDRGHGIIEIMPKIVLDFTLRVTPPPSGEIQFEKIIKLIFLLNELHVPIKWVSTDGFQSAHLIQRLRAMGFAVGVYSVDRTMQGYSILKDTIYDGRLSAPQDEFLVNELLRLEYDIIKKKVDHVSTGTKDVSDAVTGVVAGLTLRREVWAMHDIPMSMVPAHLFANQDRVRSNTDDEQRMLENHSDDGI